MPARKLLSIKLVKPVKCHMILAVMVLLFSASVACVEAQTVTIEGTARDAQLGSPLAGVAVYLIGTPAVAITKTTGRFVFNDVKAGTYPIKAVYNGYTSINDTLVVSGDASIKRDFALQSETQTVAPASPTNPSSQPATVQITPENELPELNSVCDCFDFAMDKLDEAMLLREQHATLAAFKAKKLAVDQMDKILKTWQSAQQQCLISFGTKLFRPSACNRPGEVTEKRSKLSSLGIKN